MLWSFSLRSSSSVCSFCVFVRDFKSSRELNLPTVDGFALHIASKDEKIKISSNDTTAGYLLDKVGSGNYVTLTENGDGGNETVTITSQDERSKVSANDTTEGYLVDKLTSGNHATFTETNDGANETLHLTTKDERAKVSANDTTEYLGDGVYIGYEDYYYVLSTKNNIIYLDPLAIKKLLTYFNKNKEWESIIGVGEYYWRNHES